MEAIIYRCPNCGAPLEFNVDTQKFDCKFCNSEFSHDEILKLFSDNENQPLDKPEPTPVSESEISEFCDNTSLYQCPNCGAQVIADNLTSSTRCHFCHTPVILTGRLSGEYRPSKMIPFQIQRSEAENKFLEWTKKKKFLPKNFRSEGTLSEITGLYVPFWLGDALISVKLEAECKKTHSWRGGGRIYTNTKIYSAYRDADVKYEGIPADGSSKIDDKLMENLEPFDYSKMIPFSMSYLSGYVAEKYDVNKEETYGRIQLRSEGNSVEYIKKQIAGYSSVAIKNAQTQIQALTLDYALLPIWFLTYNHKGVNYYFAINGQTGKMSGSLPIWWAKFFALFIPISILIAGIIFGGGMFLL